MTSSSGPILVALGTRPEVIKLAPLVLALRRRGVPTVLLSTGQHRELLDPALEAFGLVPDRDLRVMRPNQGLAGLSARLLEAVDAALEELQPRWVVVQGDTTTVAMTALAAFYRQIPVAHVEAGLRTGERYDPFPEELNRSLLGRLADLHFAPTAQARANLLAEGIAEAVVPVVGNPVIDALEEMRRRLADRPWPEVAREHSVDLPLHPGRAWILVTGHRRENFGAPFEELCRGLRRLAQELGDKVEIVFPLHLNPRVRAPAREHLSGLGNLHLIEPLAYPPFVKLLTSARMVITDSGGVQEEATALGLPALVTRRTSERPEAVASGVAQLVGTDAATLVAAARRLVEDQTYYASRAVPSAVFGGGRASERIADALLGDGG